MGKFQSREGALKGGGVFFVSPPPSPLLSEKSRKMLWEGRWSAGWGSGERQLHSGLPKMDHLAANGGVFFLSVFLSFPPSEELLKC
jgi:hypothetical protein